MADNPFYVNPFPYYPSSSPLSISPFAQYGAPQQTQAAPGVPSLNPSAPSPNGLHGPMNTDPGIINGSSRDAGDIYSRQQPQQAPQQKPNPQTETPKVNMDPLQGLPINAATAGFRTGFGVGNPAGGAAAGAGLNLLFQYIHKKFGTGRYDNTYYTGDQAHSMGNINMPRYIGGTRTDEDGNLVVTGG